MLQLLLKTQDDIRAFIRANGLEVVSAALPTPAARPGAPITERNWKLIEMAMQLLAEGSNWVAAASTADEISVANRAKASWTSKVRSHTLSLSLCVSHVLTSHTLHRVQQPRAL